MPLPSKHWTNLSQSWPPFSTLWLSSSARARWDYWCMQACNSCYRQLVPYRALCFCCCQRHIPYKRPVISFDFRHLQFKWMLDQAQKAKVDEKIINEYENDLKLLPVESKHRWLLILINLLLVRSFARLLLNVLIFYSCSHCHASIWMHYSFPYTH